MDKRIVFDVTRETLLEVGVSPDLIVKKISEMDAKEVKPVYIRAYLILIVSSS